MRFEYFRAPNGNWYWHLRNERGYIIAQGQSYSTEADCRHAIELVKSAHTASEIDVTPKPK